MALKNLLLTYILAFLILIVPQKLFQLYVSFEKMHSFVKICAMQFQKVLQTLQKMGLL